MTSVAAHADHATKVYGYGEMAVTALDDISVSFESGKFNAIMGPSGSGKSTLMHCMAGLDDLTSGSVYIGGVDLSTLDDKTLTHLRRDQVGFIFQAFNLVPTLTARENITLPMDLAGRDADEDWVSTVIETIGIADRLTHLPKELSGGQQQRVAAARALASRPELIFADEPERQPRFDLERRTARLSPAGGARVRSNHRHGHPRSDCSELRRPHCVPRRRQGRR